MKERFLLGRQLKKEDVNQIPEFEPKEPRESLKHI